MTEEAVRAQREQWEQEGVILGYQAVVNEEYEHDSKVAAFIEVKMTPERDGGFDRLAMRISRFDEVSSCYLASGGFDLLVLVEGKSMREIARFVAEKLSTQEGVLSTSTHFHLKTYKKKRLCVRRSRADRTPGRRSVILCRYERNHYELAE
ncbi:Lrp/AsnC family transcriptional regulator [Akkermansia muciniphila]|uniref:Lrp/AsnC family transcriptional regulator n=1 Tax=Akkermansia muciniphila TaxID=239935 RepID=UPI0027D2409F|nr:Lrp/AsnC family transcriptional regulator [Akkermansia muciniphila]WMB14856.1 Lrp/AsnC family transcriptional regulator [Akkermansia muciniphila]